MTTYRGRTVVMLCVGVLLAISAVAQPVDRRPLRAQDDTVTFESFVRTVRADSSVVDILFRFRHDFFVFARQNGSPLFTATGEVTVEILDSAENSVSRHIQTFTMSSNDNSLASLRHKYWQGVVSFPLFRGRHTALCVLTDKVSEHKQFQMRLPLLAPRSQTAASSLLLAQAFDSAAGLVPCNLGGDAFFNSPLFVAAELHHAAAPATAVYSLTRRMADADEHPGVHADTTVPMIVLPHTRLVPEVDSAHTVLYRFAPDPVTSVAIVSLDGEKMAQGRYELRLRFDAGDTAALRTNFALRWIDMPQSLRDIDFATAAMKYITTEDEYDRLRSGHLAARVQAFDDFWKKRDPTPATAYNEQLAEYFRRVDHAFTTFRTLKEENGITTDRGRIYILYGAPASTDRLLSPENAPREVWRYPSLKKVFTFEDTSRQGNYKLIQSDTQ